MWEKHAPAGCTPGAGCSLNFEHCQASANILVEAFPKEQAVHSKALLAFQLKVYVSCSFLTIILIINLCGFVILEMHLGLEQYKN